MVLGFLSDAHGNSLGLEKCMSALRRAGAEQVFFLGDSVGYLPDAAGVLNRLKDADALCIRGNHEAMLLGSIQLTAQMDAVYRLSEARGHVASNQLEWIREWPVKREIVADSARLLLVHGSPRDPIEEYVYPDSDLTPFAGLPYDYVFCGHTHRPFIRRTGNLTFVNVGSCGLPRDAGNLGSCALYDSAQRTVEILRVEFDAASLKAELGDRIAQSVGACLLRAPSQPVIGTLVHA